MLTNTLFSKSAQQKEEKLKEAKWSTDIRTRDDWSCVICGTQFHTNAHHIIPRENKQYKFDLDNGITLCTKHHKFSRIISAHNNPMAFFLWLQKYRYPLFVTAVARTIQLTEQEVLI
jgi:hypothetical protein